MRTQRMTQQLTQQPTQLFKKVACFTDIHFGLKSNSSVHNKDCEDFVDWYIAKAKEEGCDT